MDNGSQYGQAAMNGNYNKPKRGTLKIVALVVLIMMLVCCCGIGAIVKFFFNVVAPKEPFVLSEVESVVENLGYKSCMVVYNGHEYTTEGSGYEDYITIKINSSDDKSLEVYNEFILTYDLGAADSKFETTGQNYRTAKWSKDNMNYYACQIENSVLTIKMRNKAELDKLLTDLGL